MRGTISAGETGRRKLTGRVKSLSVAGLSVVAAVGLLVWQMLPASAATQGQLVGYWKMDTINAGSPNTTPDSSGNSFTGSLSGTPANSGSAPTTKFTDGASLNFGGSDYMQGPQASSFGLSSAMSYSAWINPTSVTSTSPQVIMADMDGTGGAELVMSGSAAIGSCNAHSLCFIAYAGGSPVVAQEALSNLTAGSWQQIVGTYDGSNVNLYVAGIKVQATAATGSLTAPTGGADFCVATAATSSTCSTSGSVYTGKIDEVRVYNRALSNAEATQLSGGNDTTATWNGSVSTDFNNPANWDINAVPDAFTNIVVPSYAARELDMTSDVQMANLEIDEGPHDNVRLYSYNLTMNNGGKFSNNGNLYLSGTQTLTNFADDTYVHSPGSYYNDGTIIYDLSSNLTSLPGGYNYMNVSFEGSGTVTLPSDISADTQYYSTISVGSGTTLDLNSHNLTAGNVSIVSGGVLKGGGGTLTLYDDGTWNNAAGTSGFVAGTSTVAFNIGGTIDGNTTFYNFSDTDGYGNALTFRAGSTQTVTHSLSLVGEGSASTVYSRLTLQSSSPGTQWKLDASGATTTTGYLNVQDSNNLSSQTLVAGYSVDNHNNTNWYFVNPAISSLGPSKYVDSSWVNDSTPTLTFDAESGNPNVDVSYEVQISKNSNYSSPVVDYTSVLAAPGVTSFTPGSALPSNGNYYWRVRAINDGGMVSDWSDANDFSQAFQLDTTAPGEPTANVAAGSYNHSVIVQLTEAGDGGGSGIEGMYYTTDGSTPTDTNGTEISNNDDVSISSTTELKVAVLDNAGNSSTVLDNTYTIDAANPNTPTASPTGGNFNTNQTVTLSATDNSGGSGIAGVYYTTNGDQPSSSGGTSTEYTSAISVTSSETVKAIAYDNAGNASSVMSETYTIDKTVPNAPSYSPSAGDYNSNQTVTLSATDNSGGSGIANIYYTTNGSAPTTSSASINSGDSITVSSSETVKAISQDNAGNTSSASSAAYVIDKTAPADPTISPSGGDFDTAQSVTLSSSDAGGSGLAGVYYTTNGTTPNCSSTQYSSALSVTSTETIKAIACDNAGNSSDVSAEDYVIDTVVPNAPVADPTGGHYHADLSVELTATDNSGGSGIDEIYYTTNGSAPTNASIEYTAPISVPDSGTMTIKAIAYDNVGHASSVMSETYDFDTTPPTTPSLSVPDGNYNSNQTVTLTATDSGGSGLDKIYYTTDGSTPDNTDPSVNSGGTVTVSSNETLKAIAYDNAGNVSGVASADYVIDKTAPTLPTANPPAGSYNSAQSVTLSSSDSGGSDLAGVYYTTNGTTPNCSSTQYSSALSVTSTETIKAIACDNAGNSSSVVSFAYSFDTTAPNAPNLSVATGSYNSNQTVTLTATDNSGGSGIYKIYYTTNGTTPDNTASSVNSGGTVTVSSNETLKTIAYDNAGNSSTVTSAAYIIDKTAPTTPAANPPGGWYNADRLVTLTSSDSGGSGMDGVYYTTNGSTPNQSSSKYTGAFTVSSNETIKAIAYDNVGNASSVASVTYSFDKVAPTTPGFSVATGYYNATQSVAITASDSGGSGLAGVYYTTNGTTPNCSSTQYSSALSVTSTETIKAIACDNAGNSSAVMTAVYTIDTVVPAVQSVSPANGATSVAAATNLTITFNKTMYPDAGYVTVYQSSDDSIFDKISATSNQVTGSGSGVITVTLSKSLAYSTGYYALVDGTAFKDLAGNHFAGVSGKTSWSFSTGLSPSQIALNKINAYKNSGGTTDAPTAADYIAAGITGVTNANVAEVNKSVAASNDIQGLASLGISAAATPATIQKIIYRDTTSAPVTPAQPQVVVKTVTSLPKTKVIHEKNAGAFLGLGWWWLGVLFILALCYFLPSPHSRNRSGTA